MIGPTVALWIYMTAKAHAAPPKLFATAAPWSVLRQELCEWCWPGLEQPIVRTCPGNYFGNWTDGQHGSIRILDGRMNEILTLTFQKLEAP